VTALRVGDRVRFVKRDGQPRMRVGQVVTVREVRARRTGEVLFVRVDNGDPANPDPMTNGQTLDDWFTPDLFEIVEGGS
jgi:hypothetical protein